MLSHFYHWSHEDTGRLTIRQANGYYERIKTVFQMVNPVAEDDGTEDDNTADGDNKGLDMDAIFDEAEELGLPTPPRE